MVQYVKFDGSSEWKALDDYYLAISVEYNPEACKYEFETPEKDISIDYIFG